MHNAKIINFIQDLYQTKKTIPLHAPIFKGNEKKYVTESIDSTFVSSIGNHVNKFEFELAKYTRAPAAIVTVNGTSALHLALLLAKLKANDYVLTQALNFVASCNAISYCGAEPIFLDVNTETLGLDPKALLTWLEENAYITENNCYHKKNHRSIKVCLPMHTFGHPAALQQLQEICQKWHLFLIEDAAEALGSFYQGKHVGINSIGILSFNGNKIVTSGGGGAILADPKICEKAKHLSTTAKAAHPYEYFHNEIGFNYRLPNINAALGLAQLELLPDFLKNKRNLALKYKNFFTGSNYKFVQEPPGCQSNYWLNAVICEDAKHKEQLLNDTHRANIMTRPIWQSIDTLPMYNNCIKDNLQTTKWLCERIVNLPSSVREKICEK